MTSLGDSWFSFDAIDGEEPGSYLPPVLFHIEFDEIPDCMRLAVSEAGFYQGQIRWRVTSYHTDISAPYEIEVEIHGEVNPSYSSAIVALFGGEVGNTLLMKGKGYLAARKESNKEYHAERQNFMTNLRIVEHCVSKFEEKDLAQQVFGRLMANSIFV